VPTQARPAVLEREAPSAAQRRRGKRLVPSKRLRGAASGPPPLPHATPVQARQRVHERGARGLPASFWLTCYRALVLNLRCLPARTTPLAPPTRLEPRSGGGGSLHRTLLEVAATCRHLPLQPPDARLDGGLPLLQPARRKTPPTPAAIATPPRGDKRTTTCDGEP
jgi:hypothetical protein